MKYPRTLICTFNPRKVIFHFTPENIDFFFALSKTKYTQHVQSQLADKRGAEFMTQLLTRISAKKKYVIARSLCGMQRFCNIPRDEMTPKGCSKTFASQTMIVQ